MKIMNTTSVLGLAFGAAMLWCAPAQANLNCPAGSEEYNGQCWSPNPSQPTSNAEANAAAQAGANASVGNVGGGSATVGPITNHADINNKVHNDNRLNNRVEVNNRVTNQQKQDQAQQQQQHQIQSIQNAGNSSVRGSGNSINNIDLSQRQAASSAIAPNLSSSYKADITSGAIQGVGFGASLGKVRPLNYEEVIHAEDRWLTMQRPGGLIYMAERDNAAIPVSRYYGLTESSQSKRDRGIAQREAATQTRFAAPEHTGSTPMVARQQRAPQAVQCPADYPVFNPATGKCRQ